MHLNLTQKIINIAEEIKLAIDQVETTFLDYENSKSGIVEEDTLEQVSEKVQNSNTTFDTLHARSINLLSRASEFIATTSLPSASVNSAYQDTIDRIKNNKDNLLATDFKAANDLNNVKDRVDSLEQQLNDLLTSYRNNDGIKYDKIGNITSEAWYSDENSAAFATMLDDDPFVHETTKHTFYEDQWVGGINGDVFGSYGNSFLYAGGSHTVQDGVTTYDGSAGIYEGNAYGQLTEYARGNVDVSIGGVNGNFTHGDNGFAANAEGHVAKLESSAVLGTDDFNGHVNFNAEALSANGQINAQLPDENGDYNFALGGNATAWKLEGTTGFSLFGVDEAKISEEDRNSGKKNEVSLLGAEIGGSVGKQARAEFEVSSTTAYDNDYFSVSSNNLKVDVALLAGVKLDISVPSISLKWPF